MNPIEQKIYIYIYMSSVSYKSRTTNKRLEVSDLYFWGDGGPTFYEASKSAPLDWYPWTPPGTPLNFQTASIFNIK